MKRQIAEKRGRTAERSAAQYLQSKGFRILAERVRNAGGEIDIVARRETMVVFVEVKWRARAADLDTAIDARRLSRVSAAAAIAMPDYMQDGDDCRIDVLLLAPGHMPRHLENAGQF